MIASTVLESLRGRASTTSPLRAHVTGALVDAVVIWCVVFLLGEYTIYHATAGTLYVFAPRGWGVLEDAAVHIFLLTGFFLFYTLPSLLARPWLGWMLRVLMFGLLVVSLAFMQFVKVVAVVETPDHKTVFYAHYPIQPRVYDQPPNAVYRRNGIVAQLSFFTAQVDDLVTYPVYRWDERGNAGLERFASHVNIMEREGSKPPTPPPLPPLTGFLSKPPDQP